MHEVLTAYRNACNALQKKNVMHYRVIFEGHLIWQVQER